MAFDMYSMARMSKLMMRPVDTADHVRGPVRIEVVWSGWHWHLKMTALPITMPIIFDSMKTFFTDLTTQEPIKIKKSTD